MKLLGIDIGTTAICGLLLDAAEFKVIKTVSKPNNSFIQSDREFEKIQNPEMIFKTVRDIIEEIGVTPDAVGFSCQMHGIVYSDKNLNAVSSLYTWQDTRGALEYKDGKSFAEYLGCYPGYGLSTFLYNRVNGIEPGNAAYISTVGDWAAAKLCSLDKPVTHITNAAGLGCFDLETNRFKCEYDMLPDVTAEFSVIGKTSEGVPAAVCVGDNQASFIGSVPDRNGILINIGTGAQISYLTESISKNPLTEARPFDSVRYLMAGCSLCGGRSLAAFEKFCREIANEAGADIKSYYPVFDRLSSENYETSLKADCRYAGTRNDPGVTGGFSSLNESNYTLRDFLFSVYDGMINELYGMYGGKGKPDAVYCSGNGIRKNPVLLNVIKKYFGAEPHITAYTEEAAFGAALTAGTAIGFFKNIDEARAHIEVI